MLKIFLSLMKHGRPTLCFVMVFGTLDLKVTKHFPRVLLALLKCSDRSTTKGARLASRHHFDAFGALQPTSHVTPPNASVADAPMYPFARAHIMSYPIGLWQ